MRNLTTNKTLFARIALVLIVMMFIAFASPLFVRADGLDGIGSSGNNGDGSTTTTETQNNGSNDDNGVAEYLKGYKPVTSEDMQKASALATPVANAIGTITGFIMIVVSAGIFLVTALDLCYIGLPFTRNFLAPDAAQAGAGAMGGMGMMGGMMPGGAMGGQTPAKRICFISDEAKNAVATAGQQAGGGAMGMPMGGMGMSGGFGSPAPMGGGMMGSPSTGTPTGTRSVILTYLKKRMFFLIIFAVASIILMSSVLTDCGINLAALLTKIIEKFSGKVAETSI